MEHCFIDEPLTFFLRLREQIPQSDGCHLIDVHKQAEKLRRQHRAIRGHLRDARFHRQNGRKIHRNGEATAHKNAVLCLAEDLNRLADGLIQIGCKQWVIGFKRGVIDRLRIGHDMISIHREPVNRPFFGHGRFLRKAHRSNQAK